MTRFVTSVSLSAVLMVAACSPGTKNHPGMIQPINNRAQFEDAVALLMDGNVGAARKMLATMAKRDPNDHQTAALIKTLDVDPIATLGTRSFAYRVQSGDRMTGLSQRFLADRLKFYLLARYNEIAVPKAIAPGQMLRIPGAAPPVAPLSPRTVKTVPNEPPRENIGTTGRPKPPADPAVSADMIRRASRLRGAGLAALNTGNVNRAVGLLRQAVALDRMNQAIRNDLARAVRIQATVAARR